MNVCDLHTQYSFNLTRLSCCSSSKAFDVLTNVVEHGLLLAKVYQKMNNPLLQELFLRRLFFDLLNIMSDPLLHLLIRRMSLDFVYKPLFALKRFYKKIEGDLCNYYKLENELRVISFEFLSYPR